MATTPIPAATREKALGDIEKFNRAELKQSGCQYIPRFRGKFLFLSRKDSDGRVEPICRLEYAGKRYGWFFAIYKYSDDRYDPEDWFFPGHQFVDGTVAGALEAGMRAYP